MPHTARQPNSASAAKSKSPGAEGSAENQLDAGELLAALRSFRRGDFSVRLPSRLSGVAGEIAEVFNDVVELNDRMTKEFDRLGETVGRQGKINHRATLPGAQGCWAAGVEAVNTLIADMVHPTAEMARVIGAAAKGDLSQTLDLEDDERPLRGEFLRIGRVVNTMVGQLGSFASEVTRVAREVGTEGKLGGQAKVEGVTGAWKDLTDNVNLMAANLTGQVRNIAEVTTAVANGDLSRKITVNVKGEVLELKNTINTMVDQLNAFASEVTRVAREVGTEGKLGGQAQVPGVTGAWKDLTDNVNLMAANLTGQMRAIAEVSTAVTKGDLTRSITVEASGEVEELKDNINEMIRNLKDQTLKNTEQDWLKTNLARFTRMLQGERDLSTVSNLVLSELAALINAQHGVFYVSDRDEEGQTVLTLAAAYAAGGRDRLATQLRLREGLIGQCAWEKSRILLTNVPNGYVRIASGLGEAAPANIIVLPALFEGEVKAVIELATFGAFNETQRQFLDQLMESIGIVLNTIAANMRTEGLLKQSQLLTSELQAQQEELKKTNDRLEQQAASLRRSEELLRAKQEELQQTNAELQEKAQLLSVQNQQVEAKNREVEQAKLALEEKAEQLALTSKYKSEFLANMSHELRTPLNSLLILSKLLADNGQGNLHPKQVEFARNIHDAGTDLLGLINDILDLSKIESGTVTLDVGEVSFARLGEQVNRTFAQVAADKKLDFRVELDPGLPRTICTDEKRLQQIIKNLLSNAFKFTERGHVRLKIAQARDGWRPVSDHLKAAGQVLAFSVEDTGIGIPEDKQRIIFEAFQQADGTTSRKYGGTGLGLSISREITHMLGGDLQVASAPGAGSTFSLYLPLNFSPAQQASASGGPGFVISPRPTTIATSFEAPLQAVCDDREDIDPQDNVVLIVADDPRCAANLLGIAHESGFKGVITGQGAAASSLARRFTPDAILLDIGLPDMDGLALLDRLKRSRETRHIPVHLISTHDQEGLGLCLGAYVFTPKPVEREVVLSTLRCAKGLVDKPDRRIVLVGEHGETAETLRSCFDRLELAPDLPSALQRRGAEGTDGLVIDAGAVSVAEAIQLLEQSEERMAPPVIFAPTELDPGEERLLRLAVFGGRARLARTGEQLIDHLSLLLHQPMDRLPQIAQAKLDQCRQVDAVLTGRKAVVIDDDIRNIFSLASALEEYGLELFYAESGRAGLELLHARPDIEVALVDVMMPDMDGYETIREIRAAMGELPIVAVTAKAMKGDRQKCIQAGATDYVAKPVDIDHLVSVLRVSLQRADAAKLAVAGVASPLPRAS